MFKDPVCNMMVDENNAKFISEAGGKKVYLCPTCAGSMVSAILGLGVVGAGAGASALAPFQTAFIAASIPALAIAPFLLARSIRSVSMCK